jgi:nucleoside-diphosphate-sugar epimerase
VQLPCRSVVSGHVAAQGEWTWWALTITSAGAKPVHGQIYSRDVANLFLDFCATRRSGEVYNLGGGRENSVSILETVAWLADMGHKLRYCYNPASGHP